MFFVAIYKVYYINVIVNHIFIGIKESCSERNAKEIRKGF